jgi:hypothetical protein
VIALIGIAKTDISSPELITFIASLYPNRRVFLEARDNGRHRKSK